MIKFRKIAYQLHLWLGVVSGIIVFIVCITGAIWAFKINGWVDNDTVPETYIHKQDGEWKKPSELIEVVRSERNLEPTFVSYSKDAPATVGHHSHRNGFTVLVNPYTGELLEGQDAPAKKKHGSGFWHFIRRGHRALWLPRDIGRPIVNYGTLLFVIVLITGLIIWIPKSKKGLKHALWFNWKKGMPWRRRLFDLHTILGLYVSFILIAVGSTGMVWGLEWWSEGTYKLTTGRSLPEYGAVMSDTLAVDTTMTIAKGIDSVYSKLLKENPTAQKISVTLPDSTDKASVISATVSPEKEVYYNTDNYSFDRYSLKEIVVPGPYNGRYKDASWGDKLRRMNYEIHTGSVLGLPGQLLVFFAALLGASLPLTGFYIFFVKRRNKNKNKKKS